VPKPEQRHESHRFSNCLHVHKSAIIARAPSGRAGTLGRNCKVTDSTRTGRSGQKRSRLHGLLLTRGGRFLLVCAFVVIMLGGGIGGYLFGVDLAHHDLVAARALIEQLQPENQRLKRQIVEQNARLIALQSKLASVQAALDSIMPSENTYNISPNQALVVADGQLTVGLIGPPTNQSVNININGKQQSAAPGDVFKIALNPSTTCQVGVQSFDMFKAIVTASCATAKPQ
jgi:hypothetical protein